MDKIENDSQHLKTATLEATEQAIVSASSKGRFKIETLITFVKLYEEEADRTTFLSKVYDASPTDKQLEIEEICKVKDWKLNKNDD